MERAPHSFSYKQQMWRHLADYKATALGVNLNGIWRKNRDEYAHILPFGYRHLNILEPYREEFWQFFRGTLLKLHSDFHHLSSSQAMCFNLFAPFILGDKKDLHSLGELFALDEFIEGAQFEFVFHPGEGTYFDFCIETRKSRILFELKLTESSFGAAKSDAAHRLKFETMYSPKLEGKFATTPTCADFLEHYQLMRNIWNLDIDTGDMLVCVVPKANRCLTKEIEFLTNCLSEKYRNRVSVYYLEDLVARMQKIIPDGPNLLQEHLQQFTYKYLPDFKRVLQNRDPLNQFRASRINVGRSSMVLPGCVEKIRNDFGHFPS